MSRSELIRDLCLRLRFCMLRQVYHEFLSLRRILFFILLLRLQLQRFKVVSRPIVLSFSFAFLLRFHDL